MGNVIAMREKEGLIEWWEIEKRNSKCDCYDRIRRIKITMINWNVNCEMNYYERRTMIKRTMINWKEKWENKIMMREEEESKERWSIEKWNGKWWLAGETNDQNKDNQLRSENGNDIVMIEEESKEW
jgi:hypothetical protein